MSHCGRNLTHVRTLWSKTYSLASDPTHLTHLSQHTFRGGPI